MLILANTLTKEQTGVDQEPLEYVTEENKLVLTLVPLQLRKAANCSCLDYFYHNLIPDI